MQPDAPQAHSGAQYIAYTSLFVVRSGRRATASVSPHNSYNEHICLEHWATCNNYASLDAITVVCTNTNATGITAHSHRSLQPSPNFAYKHRHHRPQPQKLSRPSSGRHPGFPSPCWLNIEWQRRPLVLTFRVGAWMSPERTEADATVGLSN